MRASPEISKEQWVRVTAAMAAATSPGRQGSRRAVGMAGMTRQTTFSFTLDPTPEQRAALGRHVGAARFAFNQCLRLVLNDSRPKRISQKDLSLGPAST
jgi:hypothetical protein